MKKNIILTIFTPTYNRKNEISNLYNSLLNQSDKDFIWLIVDDGSTDNTEEYINTIKYENKINIKYYKKNNGGKHSATNMGIEFCTTDYFFCVDSDDTLTLDCVEKLNFLLNSKVREEDIGLIAYKKNISDDKKNKIISKDYIYISELYAKYGFKGELAIILKTKFLKSNLFPIIDGEKFISEAWLYDILDTIGKLYFFQEVIYLYDYLEDGYTKNFFKLIKNNIKGYKLFCYQRMEIGKFMYTKFHGAVFYHICHFLNKEGFNYIFCKHFFLLVISFFPALFYYLKKWR